MKLLIVAVIILLFNLPFGYWRANVKKFSLQWALAIHLPVPFVVALRFASGIGFAFVTYPALVSAFFLGQFLGGKFYSSVKGKTELSLTSCMPCDLMKLFIAFSRK